MAQEFVSENTDVDPPALHSLCWYKLNKHVCPSRLVRAVSPGVAGKPESREQGSLGASRVLSLPYRTCVSCFPSPSGLGQRTGFS